LAEWHPLEHTLWRRLQEHGLTEKKILVGFSGGPDSLALLWALSRVLKKNVVACYVHHGASDEAEISMYRDRAAKFCREFCEKNDLSFELRQSERTPLRSEEELRNFRRGQLLEVRQAQGCDLLALGQHGDDLLETRMLRLIRGTGPQGLRAMKFLDGVVLRPFLELRKSDLLQYLAAFSLEPLVDPSNESLEPLRNWLRQQWLPALETRQAGALESLGRSLELLASSPDASPETIAGKGFYVDTLISEGLPDGPKLSRLGLLALPKSRRQQVLAAFVHAANKRDFSHAHVDEVLKRLDNPKNELMFRVGGLDWCVNAQQIWLADTDSSGRDRS
jgi:tRNA(Ile)-lysidine synthase